MIGLFTTIVIAGSCVSYIKRKPYQNWLKKIKNCHDYNDISLREHLSEIGKSFEYHGDDIPYGRSLWFLQGNEHFHNMSIDPKQMEFYGFATQPTDKNIGEMLEFGLLLTKLGLFYHYNDGQIEQSKFYTLRGLWKVSLDEQNNLLLHYPLRTYRIKVEGININLIAFQESLNQLIDTGYTKDLKLTLPKSIDDNINQMAFQNLQIPNWTKTGLLASFSVLNHSIGRHLKKIQFNSIASASMGHGHAAEYANNLIDSIRNPFSNVRQVGQDNLRNGPDRQVGKQLIQTKYCSTASNSVNAAFDSKENGGMYRYKGMQLEVPKDQYDSAVQKMAQRISENRVEGHTDPNDAYKIIRKGNITYTEAKLIAKGGNITSIKFDAIDGMVQSLPGLGISFVIVFAQAKWSGKSTKDSATLALKAGATTFVKGTGIYVASQQFGKLSTNLLRTTTGRHLTASKIAGNMAVALTFGVAVAPDIFDILQGRISQNQFLKNVAVTTGGTVGGFIGGALGSIPGALIGSAIGGGVTKLIADFFSPDDRIELFIILKQEFIDVVIPISLTKEEMEEISNKIFDENLEAKLKDMFQNKNKLGTRTYARQNIVEYTVENVLKKRSTISNQEILEAQEIINDHGPIFVTNTGA